MPKPRFFERLTLACQDVLTSSEELQRLLGCSGFPHSLGNIELDLVAAEAGTEQGSAAIASLGLYCEHLQHEPDTRGLNIVQAGSRPAMVQPVDPAKAGIQAIDHIVLMSNNADDCIRLFGQDLGMRLALDQMVEQWGGRMLFFREGSMTLEVIESQKQPPERDFFWGISYLCGNIDRTREQLLARGVDIGDIRDGRKKGTRVANINSCNAGIASLLVGPA